MRPVDIFDIVRQRDALWSAARQHIDYLEQLADSVESGKLTHAEVARELRALVTVMLPDEMPRPVE